MNLYADSFNFISITYLCFLRFDLLLQNNKYIPTNIKDIHIKIPKPKLGSMYNYYRNNYIRKK